MSRSHEWSTMAEFAANGLTIQARDAAYITYRAFSGDLQSGHSVRALARSARRIPVDHPKLCLTASAAGSASFHEQAS
jgi:hypothetical protein